MGLSPLRDALAQTAMTAHQRATPFKGDIDSALDAFQSVRAGLERQVRSGDLTIKAARERAYEAAQRLRTHLFEQAESYSPVPRVFLDRLVETSETRRRARGIQSLESLQRENNRLLRQMLIEQQLLNRAAEFEGKAFVRPIQGGAPAPTLESLLLFHESSRQAGDDAAVEWARRQLEAIRPRTVDPNDLHKIDVATDRPDRVNGRIVMRYAEALRGQSNEQIEAFVHEAVESADANACVAAFLLAREASEGISLRWVRETLDGLARFPDSALETLRSREAEARQSDAEAARTSAAFAVAIAEAEARFPDLRPPTEEELARRERVRSLPIAADNEPVGLNLARRGVLRGESKLDEGGRDLAAAATILDQSH